MVSTQLFFSALADRTRRRIINLIRDQEICVCFLTEILDVSQPKISRHLAYLRNAEIVSARREGKWIYYRLIEPEDFYAARILGETLDWLKADQRMQNDYDKLVRLCALPGAPATITRVRKSDILRNPHTTSNSSIRKSEIETHLL